MPKSTSDTQEDSGCIDHTDPETLRRLYWDEELTLSNIAERSDSTLGSVAHYMRKHGIERRTKWHNNRSEQVPLRTRKDGYEQWDGSDKMLVHRLLAVSEYGTDAVAENEVHHKIPIPWLNTPENIEIVSTTDHIREHSPIDASDVREMRRLKEEEDMYDREIADQFGISSSYVNSILNGYVWEDV